ncbi:hypothetical protein HX005_15165 [Acinetobacter sp. R933-2]|uniref:hypothetical protein n=1 Tax=Acinetobacter sp. R933-2 TaxID=2746728 RepID=UPI002577BA5E|nr:hypothetical protein [Acinetobacter sp. R933-2]MDM1248727.1 hypothetical protein [Acinetobacter sp. R933-2]
MKPLKLFGLALSIISANCVADQNVQTKMNSPDDRLLGIKIDASKIDKLTPEKLLIELNMNEKIRLNKNDMDITVFKDSKDGINKIKALIGFDLYFKNDLRSNHNYLYVQCPIKETKSVAERPTTFTQITNGKPSVFTAYPSKTLSEKVIDRGFYSFSFEPDIKNPIEVKPNTIPIEKELIALQIHYLCVVFGGSLYIEELKKKHKESYIKQFEKYE